MKKTTESALPRVSRHLNAARLRRFESRRLNFNLIDGRDQVSGAVLTRCILW